MSRRRSSARNVVHDESSVYVPQSPVSSIKQSGNLTGHVRVTRDHIADICNLINEWNERVMEGSKHLQHVGNIFGDNVGKTKISPETMAVVGPYLELVTEICYALETIVEKIHTVETSLIALQRLEELNNRTKPVFLTWPLSKFVQVVQEIYKMYKKELELKLRIKEDLYICEDAKLITFYSVAWLQQPYIEKSCEFHQKAMEIEAGFTS